MEFDNEKPIYIQIASLLKEQIASGRRRAGDARSHHPPFVWGEMRL